MLWGGVFSLHSTNKTWQQQVVPSFGRIYNTSLCFKHIYKSKARHHPIHLSIHPSIASLRSSPCGTQTWWLISGSTSWTKLPTPLLVLLGRSRKLLYTPKTKTSCSQWRTQRQIIHHHDCTKESLYGSEGATYTTGCEKIGVAWKHTNSCILMCSCKPREHTLPIRPCKVCACLQFTKQCFQKGQVVWVLLLHCIGSGAIDTWEVEKKERKNESEGRHYTRVPETKSTPFFAWCNACSIITSVDRASPSSYTLVK